MPRRKALDWSEDSVLNAFEDAPFEFWVRDAEGRCIVLNAAARKWGNLLGLRLEESPVSPEILAAWQANNRRAYAGELVQNEIESVVSGELRHYQCVVVPIRTGGQVRSILGFNIDITAHKRAEQALQAVSKELHQTLHTAAIGLTHCSRDLRYLSANPAYAQLVGVPLEQILARPMVEVLGQARFEIIRPHIQKVLSGERVEYEAEMSRPEGNKCARVVYTPDRDASGNVVGWVASVMDITKARRMEEERAQEERRKDEFLSLLGHELRNPLAAISTAMQVLSGAVTDEEHASLYATMGRQVMLMRRLLDDLLDLARITHDQIELKKKRIDLAKFLQQVIAVAQPAATERRQELILRLPTEAVTFMADDARLEQIAMNLLNNAFKYTEQEGRIEFSGCRKGSEIVLRCKDSGRGISPGMQEKIFEPFTRLGPITNRPGEASVGIGLALVKRLAELHGGTVSVESGGPGMGSEFTVRLPLEPAPSDPPIDPESEPVPAVRRKLSVVVVEDNSDVAEVMLAALKQAGHGATLFADATSALAGLPSLKPDAVLLDVGLPGMDGYELAAKLRKKRHLKHTLFIGLSGFRRPESVETFDYYFTKPLDLPALLTLLDKPAPAGAAKAATTFRKQKSKPLRTLLIEDHALLSAATAELLRSEGFEVRTALSGKEGLDAAPDFNPQLTLCDLSLPDIGGLEVVHRLRSNPITRRTYAVIVTALSDQEIRGFKAEADKMGIDDFISKPLTREALRTLVDKLKQQERSSPDRSRQPGKQRIRRASV